MTDEEHEHCECIEVIMKKLIEMEENVMRRVKALQETVKTMETELDRTSMLAGEYRHSQRRY